MVWEVSRKWNYIPIDSSLDWAVSGFREKSRHIECGLGDILLGHSSFSPQLCSSRTLASSLAVNCQLLSPSCPPTKTKLTLSQCHHPCLPRNFLPHLLGQRGCLVKEQMRVVEGLARKWDTNTSAGSGKEDES